MVVAYISGVLFLLGLLGAPLALAASPDKQTLVTVGGITLGIPDGVPFTKYVTTTTGLQQLAMFVSTDLLHVGLVPVQGHEKHSLFLIVQTKDDNTWHLSGYSKAMMGQQPIVQGNYRTYKLNSNLLLYVNTLNDKPSFFTCEASYPGAAALTPMLCEVAEDFEVGTENSTSYGGQLMIKYGFVFGDVPNLPHIDKAVTTFLRSHVEQNPG